MQTKLDVLRAIAAFLPASGAALLLITWPDNWRIGATILGVGIVGVLSLRLIRRN